jgi:hypothetical protein
MNDLFKLKKEEEKIEFDSHNEVMKGGELGIR